MLNFLQTFFSRYETFKTGKTSKTGKTLLKKLDFMRISGSYQGLTKSKKSYLFYSKGSVSCPSVVIKPSLSVPSSS